MRTMNKKVVFSPQSNQAEKFRTCYSNGHGGKRSVASSFRNNRPQKKSFSRSYSSSSSSVSSSSSALRFLKRVGAKVSKALGFGNSGRRWSGKVSSSSSSVGPGLVRSWSYAESVNMDSHRAEAIEDCIEFLNSYSSSSLQRSFSTTSCSSR